MLGLLLDLLFVLEYERELIYELLFDQDYLLNVLIRPGGRVIRAGSVDNSIAALFDDRAFSPEFLGQLSENVEVVI